MSARHLPLRPLLVALCTAIALAGCARGLGELEQRVEEIKARKGAPLEPLPVMQTFETFEYTAQGSRDPFSPSADEQVAGTDSGPRPDANRPREELENFPLDALDMVGTLGLGAEQTGLIKDPDGVIHQVRADNYLGQNFGRITAISEGQIELVELIPNGVGGWIERQASISLDAK
ncbi:MAG TPA: pilus assembly protein PilP [Pseudomonadota bacterium]|nr:pilus assembly protein PilP [Pseudomonadota bacterium]HQY36474.1 pilus assembly protein PilP [Pseudomonadota bacterium]